jgi:branched-chain amino acid transport system substrate-binding protein
MKIRYSVSILIFICFFSCRNSEKTGKITAGNQITQNSVFPGAGDSNLLTPYDSSRDLKNVIPVGILVMNHPVGNDLSLSAWNGAELAVKEANSKDGYKGEQFKLIVRTCDGPWGMGSKQTVNMVFNDRVAAILGAVDGRNSHLIEQVIAKTHVPAIGCLATEPTITEAFVPWFFRCVPDDRQQAEILSSIIYNIGKNPKVDLIYFNDYDSRNAAIAFIKISKELGLKINRKFDAGKNSEVPGQVADSLMMDPPGQVMLFGSFRTMANITGYLRPANLKTKFYGNTWIWYGDTLNQYSRSGISGLEMIAPVYGKNATFLEFAESYKKKYGYPPDLLAAYAYDGMKMILKAILAVGADHQDIRDCLSSMQPMEGVTGLVSFDQKGNLVIPGFKSVKTIK